MSAYDPTFSTPLDGDLLDDLEDLNFLNLEAGETLSAGTPVYVSANKFYAADSVIHSQVVGIVATDVLATFLAEVVTKGSVSLTGLSAGSSYFLGAGIIQTSAPSSGSVIKIGIAVSSTKLVVNIQLSVLLS